MKLPLLLSGLLLTEALAHEGHEHEAKPVLENAITGNGQFTYEADAKWGTLKDGKILGPTHGGVVVDESGLVYVSSDGPESIFVFKPDGTLVKTIGKEAQGTHHMTIVKEGDKEFLFAAHLKQQRIVKMDLDGKILLTIPNDNTGEVEKGFKGLTGVAVAADGSIFGATGYGSNMIHKFDKTGKLIMSFGGRGTETTKFRTPHTIALDTRFEEPMLLVSDREKKRLVHYSLDGKFIGVHATNLRRPCAVSFWGDYVAVAELQSRTVILDKSGTPISFLGDNPNKKHWANFRVKPEDQKVGIFSAPHGLAFDAEGNLYVQDWNATGRATKLTLQK